MITIKKIPYTLTILACLLFTVVSIAPINTSIAHAQNNEDCFFGNFESGIVEGTICKFIEANQGGPTIAFINLIFNFVTALIVSLGLISIVIGGYFYMTAGGSSDRIGQAKTWLVSAILGIILALSSWLILNTIGRQFTSELVEPAPPRPNTQQQ